MTSSDTPPDSSRVWGWAIIVVAFAALIVALFPIVGIVVSVAVLIGCIVVYRTKLRATRGQGLGVTALTAAGLAVAASLVLTLGMLGVIEPPTGGSASTPAAVGAVR